MIPLEPRRTTLSFIAQALGYVPIALAGTAPAGSGSAGGSIVASGGPGNTRLNLSPKVLQELASSMGFGFYEEGLMQSGELLGSPMWGNPRTFSGTPMDTAIALYPSTGVAVFSLYSYVGRARNLTGTITFSHSAVGVVAWNSPLSLLPGVPVEINAPVPADPTLASVRAQIYASA